MVPDHQHRDDVPRTSGWREPRTWPGSDMDNETDACRSEHHIRWRSSAVRAVVMHAPQDVRVAPFTRSAPQSRQSDPGDLVVGSFVIANHTGEICSNSNCARVKERFFGAAGGHHHLAALRRSLARWQRRKHGAVRVSGQSQPGRPTPDPTGGPPGPEGCRADTVRRPPGESRLRRLRITS